MQQNTRFVFAVLAAMLMAVPASAQNTGRTGGGNRPMSTQRTLSQVVDKANAAITNATGAPVKLRLDTGDEEIQFQSGETREVSCGQKAWVGNATDAAVDLTCQARYQMRANAGSVELVLTAMP